MRQVQTLVAAIVLSSSSPIGLSAAWAADPPTATTAAPTPATDAAESADAAGVVKTKTKSNQSNDRTASPTPCKDKAAAAPTEVPATDPSND